MNFKVLKSKIGFAAEVFGIDARQNLSHEHKIELTRLINEYAVIIFKNQNKSDTDIYMTKPFRDLIDDIVDDRYEKGEKI